MENVSPLHGKLVAVTGKLEHFTRGQAYERIRELGGIPRKCVSKKTDFLICGEKAGGKLAKARSYGTAVVTEKALQGAAT